MFHPNPQRFVLCRDVMCRMGDVSKPKKSNMIKSMHEIERKQWF